MKTLQNYYGVRCNNILCCAVWVSYLNCGIYLLNIIQFDQIRDLTWVIDYVDHITGLCD